MFVATGSSSNFQKQAQYALLVSNLLVDTPLLGALLYYSVTGSNAYAVVWYYSEEYPQISFVAVNFPMSNWPTDFDPEAQVHQSQPVTIPEGVEISTVPFVYESSPSLFSCYLSKLRTFPPTAPGGMYLYNTFNPINKEEQIQSTNRKNSMPKSCPSVQASKNWANLNMAYLSGLLSSSAIPKEPRERSLRADCTQALRFILREDIRDFKSLASS